MWHEPSTIGKFNNFPTLSIHIIWPILLAGSWCWILLCITWWSWRSCVWAAAMAFWERCLHGNTWRERGASSTGRHRGLFLFQLCLKLTNPVQSKVQIPQHFSLSSWIRLCCGRGGNCVSHLLTTFITCFQSFLDRGIFSSEIGTVRFTSCFSLGVVFCVQVGQGGAETTSAL